MIIRTLKISAVIEWLRQDFNLILTYLDEVFQKFLQEHTNGQILTFCTIFCINYSTNDADSLKFSYLLTIIYTNFEITTAVLLANDPETYLSENWRGRASLAC